MTESSNVVPSAEAVAPADQPLAQDTCVHADNSKSSKGRVIRRSSKTDYDAWAEDEMKDQASKPKSAHSRGRWDGAISPRTPGFMPPIDSLPPIELPKLPGGGGVFKCAAVAVLREEKRLMSTGKIARMALRKGYIRCQGKTPEATMASALYTDVKKKNDNSVFTRPEEGLFGLREWEGPITATADASGPLQQKTSNKRVRDKASGQAEAKPPKPVSAKPTSSSLSGEENLLLLLNAADELEAEDAPAFVIPKKRRSDTGDSSHAKRVSAAARATQAVKGRAVPINRPRPLELPINSLGHASMINKLPISAPITPSTALDHQTTSPTISPEAGPATSPSHDSHTSAAHQIFNAAALRLAAPSSRAEGDEVASASHDAAYDNGTSSSDEGEAAGDYHMPQQQQQQLPGNKLPEPIRLPMNGSLPQVGQMLAAGQFAARLIHANALVSQLEQAFGKRHPLVGKAYMAKARICQLEGSRLALLEAEQAILQAQSILHDTSEAQEEVHYLLNSIRTQAYMMSSGQHNILLNAVCPNMH